MYCLKVNSVQRVRRWFIIGRVNFIINPYATDIKIACEDLNMLHTSLYKQYRGSKIFEKFWREGSEFLENIEDIQYIQVYLKTQMGSTWNIVN